MSNRNDSPALTVIDPNATARKDRIVRTVILVGGTIFLIAMSYGSGMRAKVGEIKRGNEQRKVLQTDLRTTELSLVAREAQLQQWEARRLLSVALADLDQRNFGTAQGRLREAAARLETARKPGAATTADLNAVAERLKSIDLPPSADIGQQRAELLAIARDMDAALASVAPKPDELYVVKTPRPTANDVPIYGNDVSRRK
ncbi:MAG TPA: hypothetical protein VM490_05645 [Armatimonadaceae bacterium]|jgi:hypothetical protein|nr:hypothetical protein [Armatimonadaceae bacterium]